MAALDDWRAALSARAISSGAVNAVLTFAGLISRIVANIVSAAMAPIVDRTKRGASRLSSNRQRPTP